MAEAVVQLRASYLSGDFDAYWLFHIDAAITLRPPGQKLTSHFRPLLVVVNVH